MSIHQSSHHDASDLLKSFSGQASDYQKIFTHLASRVPAAQQLIITTFPRGGTQILHPHHLPEGMLRSYQRDQYLNDAPTWQSIVRRGPLADAQCFGGGQIKESAYFQDWMEPAGFAHVASIAIAGPLFTGYPGAWHLYRGVNEPAFSGQELDTFNRLASELSQAIRKHRASRLEHVHGSVAAWEAVPCNRQFIFDHAGKSVNIYHDGQSHDAKLMSSIHEFAQKLLGKQMHRPIIKVDRAEFTDSGGEIWPFRVVAFKSFPALGDGPYVFFCLQPPVFEWATVRPSDLQADAELSRLVSTLSFMQQEFSRMPILDEISGKAHLSPFHFHRRFTELLGQTPKNFQLACQIHHAKKLLIERKTDLADIAAKCGFAHQSHFTSRFKQATGLTPTRWRRRYSDQQNADESSDQVA